MSDPSEGVPEASGAAVEDGMSLLQRTVAVFARPASAWTGLRERAQWWFPLLVVVLVTAVGWALSYKHILLPTMVEAWQRNVDSGQMPAAQLDSLEQFFEGPAGLGIIVGQQVILLPIFTLVVALAVWFGVGFVLGTNLRYRLALEIAAWSSLISLPGFLLTLALGWVKGSLQGVHIGFGILLPITETPTKLLTALGVVLDALGPLSIWYLVVGIIGASELSGAARKSTAWVLGGLYLVLVLLSAALAALFSPAA
ncbi:MAG: hypothetical protein A2W00_06625 [Candidatus Eisenbacteria bacterium RBG_16_71_46]|nr:MAG: hypothetical protein A2W00_06625 [Candidatus Eisenbacteria bacterium RBG_16_71_46]OGF24113.1 MAG: hypothetical protein A2V63_12360 [Candidatus Eisenbacteria bacterium RBG_19FT_COMBO_70_11]